MSLAGKIALVTGGSRGIGRAISLALAGAGAAVAVAARSKDRVHAVARECSQLGAKALPLEMDVTSLDAVRAGVQKIESELGPVEILVNNAGIGVSSKFTDVELEFWEQHLRVNLTGAYLASRAVLPGMLARRWGRIINIASTAGLKGIPYVAPYVASKHGLVGLTRSLALEVAKQGITVNAICPGFVNTDLTRESAQRIVEKTGRSYEDAVQSLADFSPLRRLIEPEEVASLALYLASDEAHGITGHALVLGGEG